MKIEDIQKKAKKVGIKNFKNLSKKELIKNIQRSEGNFDCFNTATVYCDQEVCLWRKDCSSSLKK